MGNSMSNQHEKCTHDTPVMKLFKQAEFEPCVLYGFLITAVFNHKILARFNGLGDGHLCCQNFITDDFYTMKFSQFDLYDS